MIKQVKSLQLSGVKRNKPQLLGDLGDCEEIINLRYKAGAWRGVGKKDKKSYSIRSANTYTLLVKPSMLADNGFIGRTDDNKIYHILALNEGNSTETLLATLTSEFIGIAYINQSLVIYTVDGLIRIQYKAGTLITLDEINYAGIPSPRIAPGDDTVGLIDYTQINSEWAGNVSGTYTQEVFDIIYNDFIVKYDTARNNGQCFGYTSFMIAWRMFDGNYINHAGPFPIRLMNGSAGEPKVVSDAAVLPDTKYRIEAYLTKPAIYYFIPDEIRANLQKWFDAGLVESLTIFMSPLRVPYDLFSTDYSAWYNGTNVDYSAVNKIPEEVSFYRVGEIDIKTLLATPLDKQSKFTPDLTNGLLKALETNPVMEVDNFTAHQLIPYTHYRYNSRLHLADITTIPGKIPWPLLEWFDDVDADPELLCFYPITDGNMQANGWYPAEFTKGILANANYKVKIAVWLNVNNEDIVTVTELSTSHLHLTRDTTDFKSHLPLRPMLSYPDIRAYKLDVIMSYEGGETKLVRSFTLKKHPFQNYCYIDEAGLTFYHPVNVLLPQNATDFGNLTAWTGLTKADWFRQTNRVQASEVNNAFIYPAKQSYMVGNEDITVRALIVAQEQMSESQFGQYPLYAFTSEGIYAFEYQGGEVLYNRIHQFVNDVIQANSVPVAVTGGAIVFMCEDGVRILQGRQTKLISEEITQRSINPLMDQPLLIEMTSTASISLLNGLLDNTDDMKAYLHSCSIGYDAIEKELLFAPVVSAFANDPDGFTLVFSLVNRMWSKRSDSFKGFIRDGNEYLAINNKVVESVNTSDFYNLNVESGVMDKPWTFFQTRPFSFSSEMPKRMLQDILRITGENKAVYETRYYDYTLSLPVNNALYGTTSGGGTYVEGTTVAISATASEGYEFVRWVEDAETLSTDATIDVVMTGDRVIIANVIAVIPYAEINYGFLYNWYAATDVRKITSSDDWIVPRFQLSPEYISDYEVLGIFVGADGGSKLKEIGTEYWTINEGATNEMGFCGRGCGKRGTPDFTFQLFKGNLTLWTNGSFSGTTAYVAVVSNLANFSYPNQSTYGLLNKKGAGTINLVNPNTILTHGQSGTYTGNDGKVYPTICIGTQEWLARPLAETKFRDGTYITGYNGQTFTDAEWGALIIPALCAFNNDWNNV